jgi:transcriptional regulator with XRE-family HTH domain
MLNISKQISSNIFKLMEQQNIRSISALARKIGCSATTIYNITSHTNKNPSIDTVKMLSDFFGISIDEFISENNVTFSSKNKRACPLIDLKQLNALFNDTTKSTTSNAITEISNSFISDKAFAIELEEPIPPYQTGSILIFDTMSLDQISFPNLCIIKVKDHHHIDNIYQVDGELYLKRNQGLLTKKNILFPLSEEYDNYDISASLVEVKFYR